MSYNTEKYLSLVGVDFSEVGREDLRELFRKQLKGGLHGICFSAYLTGQKPGQPISAGQTGGRLDVLKPYTGWVRTFSCTEGNELIPEEARRRGLKVLAGAWLNSDKTKNEKEIANLIKLAKAGHADLVAVGNEVLYRKELSQEELLGYIQQVKEQLPGIQVGYVDAYYEFCNRPKLVEACDVIFANCYPFWEGCHIDYALLYMKDMYRRAVVAAQGKRVIISETGWPNRGTPFGAAEPSTINAMRYFINTQQWSRDEDIEIYYFSSFDEAWKISDEGDVGAYWGIWDADGNLKYC